MGVTFWADLPWVLYPREWAPFMIEDIMGLWKQKHLTLNRVNRFEALWWQPVLFCRMVFIKNVVASLFLTVNVRSILHHSSQADAESILREINDGSSTFPRSTRNEELCDPNVKQVYGYFDGGKGRKLFFWFFESRSNPSQDPLILWLDGGPGCSSMGGLFLEIGPCRVNSEGNDTELNPYSWSAQANLLFVDQPAGAGFSEGPLVTDGSFEAADDLYLALQHFLTNHSEYRTNDLYVAGVSYAGHYIPAIAHKIWRENVRGVEPNIPLRGIAIGNGWMKAAVQVLHFPQMAHHSCTAPRVVGSEEHDMRRKYKEGFCSAKEGDNVGNFSFDRIAPFDVLLPDLLDAEIKDINGTSLGLLRRIRWRKKGMLGFLQIYLAGHYVPSDQPQAALFMINDFIRGTIGLAGRGGESGRLYEQGAEL
ncbi:hypothetical protein FOL47_008127 [Perkinsus chesapeaki]|uniref:Uncharacterized protein n=1 Tax=Perkinsus chesapeaki TaxID=330153 RepID=A0A7J6LG21_PERCH|nr:hypothetical protein FOL47_008127 [Perkinsus chesapeaki]